ncbi:hypothetical protein GIB67_038507, partial [Kingdonia uniflora]
MKGIFNQLPCALVVMVWKQENGASLGNYQEEKKKLPYDGTLGNFFGPSQPVIHERVLQEHKSSLENLHLAARVPNPSHSHNKNPGSTTAGTTSAVRDIPLKHVDQVKLKAQKLKDNRDYSSLFSEDAELPVPIKGPPPQNAHVQMKPPTQISSRAPPQKKRPAGKYADEVDNEAFSMLKKLTRYNSNKFRDDSDSDSDSDMEANFDDIQKEETP